MSSPSQGTGLQASMIEALKHYVKNNFLKLYIFNMCIGNYLQP